MELVSQRKINTINRVHLDQELAQTDYWEYHTDNAENVVKNKLKRPSESGSESTPSKAEWIIRTYNIMKIYALSFKVEKLKIRFTYAKPDCQVQQSKIIGLQISSIKIMKRKARYY